MTKIQDRRFLPPAAHSCPLCGLSTNKYLFNRARDGILRTLYCNECSHGFVPESDTMGHQSKSSTHTYRTLPTDTPLQKLLQKSTETRAADRARKRRDVLLERGLVSPSAKVLDIGCSLGHLLKELQVLGCDVAGCEVDKLYATRASEYLGVNIYPGFFDPREFSCQSYDLIILSHVLEHVPKPIRFLNDCLERLSPEGSIYVEIPTLNRPYGGDLEKFFWSEHIHYFSQESLAITANTADLVISDMWYEGYFLSAHITRSEHSILKEVNQRDYRWQTLLHRMEFLERQVRELKSSLNQSP